MLLYCNIEKLKPGAVITYKEYSLDNYEKKHLSKLINKCVLDRVVPPNQGLPIEELKLYFGEDLDVNDYLYLSLSSSPRLLLIEATRSFGNLQKKKYVMIELNDYFMEMGIQEVDVERIPISEEQLLGNQAPVGFSNIPFGGSLYGGYGGVV